MNRRTQDDLYSCPDDARDCFAYVSGCLCKCLVAGNNHKDITFGKRKCPFYKTEDQFRKERFEHALVLREKKKKGVQTIATL